MLPPAPNGGGILQTNEPCSLFQQTDEHTSLVSGRFNELR